jgi:hypothetical protein
MSERLQQAHDISKDAADHLLVGPEVEASTSATSSRLAGP